MSTTIEAGDWEQQAPQIGAWTEQHRREVHPDEDDLSTELYPNPVFDR